MCLLLSDLNQEGVCRTETDHTQRIDYRIFFKWIRRNAGRFSTSEVDGEAIAAASVLGFFGIFVAIPVGILALLEWWDKEEEESRDD